jgi:2-keto-4-pentenoate hydratase
MTEIRAAAETIAAARRGRTPLEPLAAGIAPDTEADGYLIQDAVHELLAADVGARVGYKIGCTSAVMQQYLDIPHPCVGGIFAKGVHDSGVSLSLKDFVRVGVECEIAVRLARDLAPTEAPFTAEWVAEAIAKSSTTATSNGRRWARRRWLRMISSPPAACSARPCRDLPRPTCSR